MPMGSIDIDHWQSNDFKRAAAQKGCDSTLASSSKLRVRVSKMRPRQPEREMRHANAQDDVKRPTCLTQGLSF